MADLILRPSSFYKDRPWALQLREHGPAETEYHTIAHVGEQTARAIVAAGPAFWLFGDPDQDGGRPKRSKRDG